MAIEENKPSTLTRRSFLKTTAAIAGTAAIASTFGCSSTNPRGNVAGSSDVKEQQFVSGCKSAGCFFCHHLVTVREGHVVKVETKADDPREKRPCLRGRSQIYRLYNPERLKYPMKRVGERGEGKWEQITWEEALDTITKKWKGYMDEFGSGSIAYVGGAASQGYINGAGGVSIPARLRNALGWTNLSGCSDYALPKGINKVFGPASNVYGWPAFDPKNVGLSKTYIAWSANHTVAHTQNWHYIIKAKEKGTRLVVVDPVFTTIASKADLWVRPRPASDSALVLSMINVIFAEGWQNDEFILKHTCAPLLVRSDTKKFLRMGDIGVGPTEGPINPSTGQPTIINPLVVWDPLKNEPSALDAIKEPAIKGTYTINGITVRTALDLLLEEIAKYPPETVAKLTDVDPETIKELARISVFEGPVYHCVTYGSQAYDNGVALGHAMATLVAITGNIGKPGAGLGSNAFPFTFNYAFLSTTGKGSVEVPRLALFEVLETGKYKGNDYPIKSVYNSASGFISAATDENRVINETIPKLEFIVITDIAFTDAVKYADIVLPAAHPYESSDMFGGITADPFAMYMEKVIDPLYECKPEGEIARLIAGKMGVGEYFQKTDDEFLEEILGIPALSSIGVTPARLKQEYAIRFIPEGTVSNPECVFPTTSTRLEFYVENPTPRVNYNQQFDIEFERLPRFRPPKEAWPDLDIMKKYPLVLISERPRNRFHSTGHQDKWLLEIEPEPSVKINPVTAESKGIKEGDYVEIFNDRGHAVAVARISNGVPSSLLLYPKGWQKYQFKSGSWSSLTSSDFDPVAVNNSFFDTVVDIRKWKEA